MKTDLTEIIFILDRSGSMSDLESDTIGGYNSFLETQRSVDGEAQVTTVLFDDQYEVLHECVNIKDIQSITKKEYFARGMTALLDAIGKTIVDVGLRLSNISESMRPSKVILVIITDGEENASREFSYKEINKMISHQQERYSWEFIFLGANIDVEKEAKNLGIKNSYVANYVADSDGTGIMYQTLAENVASFRNRGEIEGNWNEAINNDTGKRKRGSSAKNKVVL